MNDAVFAGWDAYDDAVVDVNLGDRVVTVGREGVLAGGTWAPSAPIYVITAYNPGHRAPAEDNEVSQGRLNELLSARGVPSFVAVGRSRDRSWQEPSVAVVGRSKGEAIEIACAFGQDAIFSWDGQTLEVVPCKGRDNRRLGRDN